jgi:DNA-binding transcriptional ArsR family regulator
MALSRLVYKEPIDPRMAKALSHPVRVRALAILQDREASPSEISREIGVPIVNVSHHIKVLRELGIIEQVATRHVRGAVEHRYKIVRQHIMTVDDVEASPRDGVRAFVAYVTNRAVSDLQESIESDHFAERPEVHATWTPLELDEQGWRNLHALLDETLERALAEEEAAQARLGNGQSGGPRVRSRLATFHYEAAVRPADE